MDWNNDGNLDLIFGQRRGGINLYTGNGDGTLHFVGNVFDDNGNEIKTTFNSSPWLVDWNQDGLLDLLLTGYLVDEVDAAVLRVYPGIGDQSDSLVFDSDYNDLTWLYNLRRSTAQAYDLDGDGDRDLVLGYETGEVYFAENTGSSEAPIFGSYDVMHCDEGLINVYTRYAGSGRARPHVCDYNSDDIPDLLVGCYNGWIYVFLGYRADGVANRRSGEELSLVVQDPASSDDGFSFDLALPDGATAEMTVRSTDGSVVASIPDQTGGSGFIGIPDGVPGVYMVTAEFDGQQVSRLVMVPCT